MSGRAGWWAARARIGFDGKVSEAGRVVLVPAPNRRLVLLLLAAHANGAGRCWPSLRQLADESGLSVRSVQRAVSSLVDEGWVGRLRRPNRPTLYVLALGRT